MAIVLYPRAKPATRNRQAVIPARAVVNHGHDRGWCAPIKIKLFDVEKSRKHRPVNDIWLDTFMAQCDHDGLPHLAALALFMNQTATRISEALRVTGERIDLASKTCLLEKTKTDEWVECYLTAELALRIGALGITDDAAIFRYTDRCAVNRRIASVCKRAKIEPRTTHSVGRHSFGTNAINGGIDVKRAMDAGRWKSASLFVETYVHSDDAGRSVAAMLDKKRGLKCANPAQSVSQKRQHFGKKR